MILKAASNTGPGTKLIVRHMAASTLALAIALLPSNFACQAQTLREKLNFFREARAQSSETQKAENQINQGQTGGIEKTKLAGLDLAVWKPAGTGKAPLVIFSHGFGGSNVQSIFIMKALADAGYLVIAPNHQDAHAFGHHVKPEVGFGKAGQWSEKTYDDRRRDIVNLIQALHQDAIWDSRIDWDKMALCGHSLGGYTMLGLAGAWPGWKISGIKAVLALSPYCAPYVLSGHLDTLGEPVMYQGGTRDFGVTPSVKKSGGAYDKTSKPAYFVEFDSAGHFAWTGFNHNEAQQKLINHYCVAFMDKYVKGDNNADLQTKLDGVAELESK